MDSYLTSNTMTVLVPSTNAKRLASRVQLENDHKKTLVAGQYLDGCLAAFIVLVVLVVMQSHLLSLPINGFLAVGVGLVWLVARSILKLERIVSSVLITTFLLHPQLRLAATGDISNQWNILLLPLLILAAPVTSNYREKPWAWCAAMTLGAIASHVGLMGLVIVLVLPRLDKDPKCTHIGCAKAASIRWYISIVAAYVLCRVAFSGVDQQIVSANIPRLAWLDRQRILSPLLIGLPNEFIPESENFYLGASFIVIGIASCLAVGSIGKQRMASFFFCLFVFSLWMTLGNRNLHRCTQDILEAATVQYFVDTRSLNLLGVVISIWLGMGLGVIVHSCQLIASNQRIGLVPLMISAAGTWIWWSTAPSQLLGQKFVVTWIGTPAAIGLSASISLILSAAVIVQAIQRRMGGTWAKLGLQFLISLSLICDLWPVQTG